jgi:hypothetical protein
MSQHPTEDTRSTSECPRSSPASSECARLTAYADEFALLLALYDDTPERWQHLKAQELWLYVRGMVAGITVSAVRTRIAEIDQDLVQKAITAEEQTP